MLTLTGVTKRFGALVAVDNLTLTVPAGCILGFVGPNGAGKTTTLRMAATLLEPDAGVITIDGYDIRSHRREARRALGFMPDVIGIYDDLKVWEYLDFFAAAYRVPKADRPRLIDEVLALTDLGIKRDAFVDSLSRGMKQRLCLAKTLIHDPKLLLLDEPASGLDPRARIELRELLKELQRMGKTIVISSHILTELAELCDHIAIVEKGKLITSGNLDTIMRQVAPRPKVVIEVEGGVEMLQKFLATVETVTVCDSEGDCVTVEFVNPDHDTATLLPLIIGAGLKVRQFSRLEANVENVFMQLTKGEVS